MLNRLILFFAFLFLCFFFADAQSSKFEWAKGLGSSGADYAHNVTVDLNGNVYTSGRFNDSMDFDPGTDSFNMGRGMFILKLDSSGKFKWAKEITGAVVKSNTMASDQNGNIYIGGYFFGTADFDPGPDSLMKKCLGGFDIFIMKLDSIGNLLWAQTFDNLATNECTLICVDSLGNSYTAGYFEQQMDFDPSSNVHELSAAKSDIFILKLDSEGNFIWVKKIGSDGFDRAKAIAIGNNKHIYVAGEFSETVDFDPNMGTSMLNSEEGAAFMLKIDSNGKHIWSRNYAGTVFDIAVDGMENVYSSGIFYVDSLLDFDPGKGKFNLLSYGASDMFISKLDALGNFLWAKQIGGEDSDLLYSMDLDSCRNIYLTGSFKGICDFNPSIDIFKLTSTSSSIDIFISKLNEDGEFKWAKKIGGGEYETGNSIKVDALDNIYTVGRFGKSQSNYAVDFDTGNNEYFLNHSGGSDIFIHKLSQVSKDLKLVSLLNPFVEIRKCLSDSEKVEVSIANAACEAIDFSLDTAIIIIEVNKQYAVPSHLKTFKVRIFDNFLNDGKPLEQGDSIIIPIGYLDMSSIQEYIFNISVSMVKDYNSENDSLVAIVSNSANPGEIKGPYKICGEGYINLTTTGSTGEIQWQRLIGNRFLDEPGAIYELHTPYITSITTSFRLVACGKRISDTITIIKEFKPSPPTVSHDSLFMFYGQSGVLNLIASSTIEDAEFNWYKDKDSKEAFTQGDRYSYSIDCTNSFYSRDTFYVSSSHPKSNCESNRIICTAVFKCSEKITSISIVPGLNKGVFNIIGKNIEEPVEVSIFNLNGKLVYKLDKQLFENFNEEIVLTEIAKGMYIVKVQGIFIQEIQKIVIQ